MQDHVQGRHRATDSPVSYTDVNSGWKAKHTCNPSYLGGWGQKDLCLIPAWPPPQKKISTEQKAGYGGVSCHPSYFRKCKTGGSRSTRPCLQNNQTKKGWRRGSSRTVPAIQAWSSNPTTKASLKTGWKTHISFVTMQHLQIHPSLPACGHIATALSGPKPWLGFCNEQLVLDRDGFSTMDAST
jgi:hypothetical protein